MGREYEHYEQGQVLSNLDERFSKRTSHFSIELRKWNNFYISVYFSSLPHYPGLATYCNLLLEKGNERSHLIVGQKSGQDLTCESCGVLVSPEVVRGHTGVITKHRPLHGGQLQWPGPALLGHQHLVGLKHLDRVFVPGYLSVVILNISNIWNIPVNI